MLRFSKRIKINNLFFRNNLCLFPKLRFQIGTKLDQGMEQQVSSSSRLKRTRDQGHGIAHLKRKKPKDRYSIHKLTNIEFLCALARGQMNYQLMINQKITLLAQMFHVFTVLGKELKFYYQFKILVNDILKTIEHPQDFPCLGTLTNTFAAMEYFDQSIWQGLMDCIMVDKYDEDYDQLFGLIVSLNKYRQYTIFNSDYAKLSKDSVIPLINIFYRNSLNVLMQFIRYGLYNQKQCQLIIKCLYAQKINEGFFWETIRDWFNIHIKQQIRTKDFDDFFILNQENIDRVLYDQGMIRPRPILQQLTSIAFALSENGLLSKRFLQLLQVLIIFTMENGQALYSRFLSISASQQQVRKKTPNDINQHMKINKQQQMQNMLKMQQSYKTIFINPIDIRDQTIVQMMMIVAKYQLYLIEKAKQVQQSGDSQKDSPSGIISSHVIRWLWIRMCRPQMRYTVKQLLNINKCAFIFNVQRAQVQAFIMNRLENSLRMLKCSYTDLQKLLIYLPNQDFDKVDPVLQNFLKFAHPADILRLTKLVERQNWIPFMVHLFLKLPQMANFHQKYYSFQQNCYFLYICLKHQNYWEDQVTIQYKSEMQRLKQTIKTVTYSRGFKLTMDSYFHKLLQYVDVVDFFEGGN